MPQSRRLKPGLTAAAWRPFIWAVNGPAARLACVVCRASPGRPGRGGVGRWHCQGGAWSMRRRLFAPPHVEQVTRHHAARSASASASEDHVARPARRTACEPPAARQHTHAHDQLVARGEAQQPGGANATPALKGHWRLQQDIVQLDVRVGLPPHVTDRQ